MVFISVMASAGLLKVQQCSTRYGLPNNCWLYKLLAAFSPLATWEQSFTIYPSSMRARLIDNNIEHVYAVPTDFGMSNTMQAYQGTTMCSKYTSIQAYNHDAYCVSLSFSSCDCRSFVRYTFILSYCCRTRRVTARPPHPAVQFRTLTNHSNATKDHR